MLNEYKKVFLTGASGFVASQILAKQIEVKRTNASVLMSSLVNLTKTAQGFFICASVRSESKAHQIIELHPEWKDKATFVTVPDIIADDAFDDVFKQEKEGSDFLIHTASPVNFSVTDIQKI